MIFARKTLGEQGERFATKWYQKQGFRVCAKNYRTRQGEVDIIVQKGNLLVFVEVKTRSAQSTIDTPAAFVTKSKQRRLAQAAKAYCVEKNIDACDMRFDVAEVLQDANKILAIHCIENAFLV